MSHSMDSIPAWEKMFKIMTWKQLGNLAGKRILDFGSGHGITADHYALRNTVIAVEPSVEMLNEAWNDNGYQQIIGDISTLAVYPDNSFDLIICHNVLEYIEDQETVICELARLLTPGGTLSLVKHNRTGRVFQMAVLLDDTEKANALLNGENSTASRFGTIRYYKDEDILVWCKVLKLVTVFGIRTFWDLQQNQDNHTSDGWQRKMLQLEERVSVIPEYQNVAFFHHLIFTKK